MATRNIYAYMNSLYSHDGVGAADADTRIPNWVGRIATNAGHTFNSSGELGFITGWALPPAQAQTFPDAGALNVSGGWANADAANVDKIYIVVDNFQQPDGPAESTDFFGGGTYVAQTLNIIDTWEANTNDTIQYRIWVGVPFGDTTISQSGFPGTAQEFIDWKAYGIGAYKTWHDDFLTALQAARPALDIDSVDISRVMINTFDNTAVSSLTFGQLFEDDAPHGLETYYFLAGMATYIDVFQEAVPAGYVPEGSVGVNSVVTNNLQDIKDYLFSEILGAVSGSVVSFGSAKISFGNGSIRF